MVIRNGVLLSVIDKRSSRLKMQNKNLIQRLLNISVKEKSLEIGTLVDIVINFVSGGRSSLAAMMTWALYNLVCFPATRHTLLDDIRKARTSHPEDLWSQLKEMVYVEAWIFESMRFHAPIPTVGTRKK